ncbi:MAG TPA: TIGR03086 family metal-binding protein [Streptosporangiaceae bacterium]|nr:TIGR03086 family metal-binding protein [Streptosporangiaceae bacterium]
MAASETGQAIGPETGRDIVGLDARAVRASVQIVSQAGAADLARPTPCSDWTLGELLAHMTAQHNGFAAAAAGDGADLVHWQTGAPVADPVGDYAAAAERVTAAFAAAGALAGEFVLPEISPKLRFPAAEAIGFHFVDYVVHGWDVARALGRGYDLEPDVLAAALPIAEAVPDGERRRRPGAAFAPRVAASSGGPLGQIVALLGRRPDWSRDPRRPPFDPSAPVTVEA